VNILVGKELEKSPFNCYLQVNVSVDFYLYSVIVRILHWHLIHPDIEKFYVFYVNRYKEVYAVNNAESGK
jgi:hypothetical protein